VRDEGKVRNEDGTISKSKGAHKRETGEKHKSQQGNHGCERIVTVKEVTIDARLIHTNTDHATPIIVPHSLVQSND
jgi:hypothetical protein